MNLGWSKQREVRVMDDNRAYFEIAEEGHCGVCQGRIRSIQAAVSENKVDAKYAYLYDRYPADARTLWVGIPVTAGTSNKDIDLLLREKLNLPR